MFYLFLLSLYWGGGANLVLDVLAKSLAGIISSKTDRLKMIGTVLSVA